MRKIIGYPLLFLSSLLLIWTTIDTIITFWNVFGALIGIISMFAAPLALFFHAIVFIYLSGDWTELILNIILIVLILLADKLLKVKYVIRKPKQLHITENNLPQIDQYDALKSVLSIPLVYYGVMFGAALTLIISVVLIFVIYYVEAKAIGRVHVYVLLAIGIGAFYGIVGSLSAIIKSFTRKPDYVIGFLLKDHNSEIYKITREVANRVNAPMPDNILIVYASDFHVQKANSRLATGEKITGNTLTIGYPFIKYLSTTEIKAVIAHEMAHFTGKDTVFSTKVAPAYRSLRLWITNLGGLTQKGDNDSVWYALPNLLPLLLAGGVFKWYTKNLSRIDRVREARADMIGSICYGTNAFSNSLKKVKQIGYLFDQVSERDQFKRVNEGLKFDNYFKYFDENYIHDRKVKDHLDEIIKTDKITSEFDTHYSFEERIAYLPDDNAVEYDVNDRIISKSLMVDYEVKLTEIYSKYVHDIVEAYKIIQKKLEEQESKRISDEKQQGKASSNSGQFPRCPKCGREYSESMKKCNYCDIPLIYPSDESSKTSDHTDTDNTRRKCEKCGFVNSHDAKFCKHCGVKI